MDETGPRSLPVPGTAGAGTWGEPAQRPAAPAPVGGTAAPAGGTGPGAAGRDTALCPSGGDEEHEARTPPTTGDPGVDEAVARLAGAAGQPLEALLDRLETAHRQLRERLADVEG